MASGAWADVNLSWATPQPANFLEVCGTNGLLELSGKKGCFLPQGEEAQAFSAPDDPLLSDPFAAELAWFLDCVDGKQEPRATAEDGLEAIRILEAAYACAVKPGWTPVAGAYA